MKWALRALACIPLALLSQALAISAFADDEPGAALQAQQFFYREPGMIGVEVRGDDGVLTLSGNVPTDAYRTRAAEIAREVAGIVEVRNRLRVAPAPEELPDEDLMAEIEAKIAEDSELAEVRPMLLITVKDANVTLRGHLPGWRLVKALIRGIRRIPGIKTLDFMRLTGD
ncbi:MAG: BON domain-containing protein [Myxococcota bacterium]